MVDKVWRCHVLVVESQLISFAPALKKHGNVLATTIDISTFTGQRWTFYGLFWQHEWFQSITVTLSQAQPWPLKKQINSTVKVKVKARALIKPEGGTDEGSGNRVELDNTKH